jgi:hypothetical protein
VARADRRTGDNATWHTTQFFNPSRKLAGITDSRRQEQHANSRRRQDDCFFPNVPAIFVAEVVSFIEDHQIDAHVFAATQRVEQLVPIDFRRADN